MTSRSREHLERLVNLNQVDFSLTKSLIIHAVNSFIFLQASISDEKQSLVEALSHYVMDRGRFLTMTEDGGYVELKPMCKTVMASLKQKLREDFMPEQKANKMANVMAKLEGYFKANESSQTG